MVTPPDWFLIDVFEPISVSTEIGFAAATIIAGAARGTFFRVLGAVHPARLAAPWRPTEIALSAVRP